MAEGGGIAAGSIGIASIVTIAESKLNTIQNHVSKAIQDGCISQEEFVLISEERSKYLEMKENIRTKFIPKDVPKDAPKGVKRMYGKEKKIIILLGV